MTGESMTSDEGREEDPASEARRFWALLALLQEIVPELRAWQLDDANGEESDSKVLGLSEVAMLVDRHLFDDDDRPVGVTDVWPRVLAVVEVALELCDLLFDDERDDDGLSVDVFAGSGIMCDITRSVASLEALLPWMGPVCVEGARAEVTNHTASRGYDIDDVDWSKGGVLYQPLAVSLPDLVPERRT